MFTEPQYKTLDEALDGLKASLSEFQGTIREIRKGIATNGDPRRHSDEFVRPYPPEAENTTRLMFYTLYQACQKVVSGYEDDYVEEELVELFERSPRDRVAYENCKKALELVNPKKEPLPRVYIKPEALKQQHYYEQVTILLKTYYPGYCDSVGYFDREEIEAMRSDGIAPTLAYQMYARQRRLVMPGLEFPEAAKGFPKKGDAHPLKRKAGRPKKGPVVDLSLEGLRKSLKITEAALDRRRNFKSQRSKGPTQALLDRRDDLRERIANIEKDFDFGNTTH